MPRNKGAIAVADGKHYARGKILQQVLWFTVSVVKRHEVFELILESESIVRPFTFFHEIVYLTYYLLTKMSLGYN